VPPVMIMIMETTELTDREKAILVFERQWWQYAGAKEQKIREEFDVTTTRFYQEVNRIIDLPAALEFDPLGVKRLQRMRRDRQRSRSASRLGLTI